jgi:hypothetical protein
MPPVMLTFPKGARAKDPNKLFNTRLDSETVLPSTSASGTWQMRVVLEALILKVVELTKSKVPRNSHG